MGKKRFLLVLASLFVLVAFGPATIQGENTCGDANGDGQLNVGDAVFMINYVFKGGPAPDSICCPDCSNCTDGTLNGSETDVDCGGPDCPPCSDGSICVSGSDCLSGVCSGGICQPLPCNDGILNGAETDIDCGGPDCPPCSDGSSCALGSDCLSGVCSGGICQPPTCNDGVQNGEETGIDCGGPECPPCGNNFD